MSALANLAAAAPMNIPQVLDVLVKGLEAGSLQARCRCAEVSICHVINLHSGLLCRFEGRTSSILADEPPSATISCSAGSGVQQPRAHARAQPPDGPKGSNDPATQYYRTLSIGSRLHGCAPTPPPPPAQALWRLARSGVAAADATVIAQLQTRGAGLAAALVSLLEDPRLGASAAGMRGVLAVVGLSAAVTHDTPAAALMGSAVASQGGVPKVSGPLEAALAALSITSNVKRNAQHDHHRAAAHSQAIDACQAGPSERLAWQHS